MTDEVALRNFKNEFKFAYLMSNLRKEIIKTYNYYQIINKKKSG